ncbi:hypothetical protein Tco_0305148 [Tanacetum coccineum]
MILESVEHDPLIWPTIEENGVTRTKKYVELSATEKIQADCDLKATNIILQGLPSNIYSLVNHHRIAKDLWERIQLLMQGTLLTKLIKGVLRTLSYFSRKRISDKRTKNEAKNDKTEHGMEKREKVKVNKVQVKVNYKKSRVVIEGIGEKERLMAKIALGFYLTQETHMLEALSEETQEGAQDLRTLSIKIGLE